MELDDALVGLLLYILHDAQTVDATKSLSADFQYNPLTSLGDIELLCLKIWVKTTLRLHIGVRNVISYSRALAG